MDFSVKIKHKWGKYYIWELFIDEEGYVERERDRKLSEEGKRKGARVGGIPVTSIGRQHMPMLLQERRQWLQPAGPRIEAQWSRVDGTGETGKKQGANPAKLRTSPPAKTLRQRGAVICAQMPLWAQAAPIVRSFEDHHWVVRGVFSAVSLPAEGVSCSPVVGVLSVPIVCQAVSVF